MRISLAISIFLIATISSLGQNGVLQIELNENYDDEGFDFTLLIKDSVVNSIQNESWFVEFDSLETANYTLVINSKKYDNPTTYQNIKVYSDSTTTLSISTWTYSVCCNTCNDSAFGNRLESLISFLYAPYPQESTPFINHAYSLSFGEQTWLDLHKNFDLGIAGEIYFDRTYLDSTFKPAKISSYEKQLYTNTGLKFSVLSRIAFFNAREWMNGVVMDVGASYKLPVHFRYITKSEGSKISQRKLHNFQDVNAFVKVGFTPVTLMLNYRLFDFVKDNFPQQPKWSAGLSFVILN